MGARGARRPSPLTSEGFAPVLGSQPRVLILGSLPGRVSITAQQYYAQPRNAFWPIMRELFDAGPELAYAERTRRLHQHGIALWDVLRAAQRPGSLDADIVRGSEQCNDIGALLAISPTIKRICFNGATATRLFERHVLQGSAAATGELKLVRLPSTSPAHAAMPFAEKLAAWQRALRPR